MGTAWKEKWLPAAEIRGEGIFISLDLEQVEDWEDSEPVKARWNLHMQQLLAMPQEYEPPINHSPRLVLLHSLSHALMRVLSLECGYSSAALTERVYCGPTKDHPERKMAGILVYTGSPDAGGTLGGLVRRGRPEFIFATLKRLLLEARWCSTDPLCISGASSTSVPTNLAACHGCLLTPETSCEFPYFNGYLDRALLVGEPGNPQLGYFHEVLGHLTAHAT